MSNPLSPRRLMRQTILAASSLDAASPDSSFHPAIAPDHLVLGGLSCPMIICLLP
jgi:hypothetical protein